MAIGLARSQRAFTAALFDPAAAVPAFLRNATSPRAASAFGVYRNNVASSLINVLTARFPVILRLIGDDAFRGLALRFITLYPPRSPVLMGYGDGFAEFLRCLSVTAMAEYLADIARLEVARGHAYHAVDAEPVAPECFAALTPAELPALQVLLHPSLTLLRSRFPVVSAWEVNQVGAEQVIRCWKGEDAAVFRPCYEVQVIRLAEGGFAFLSALADGATLASAIEAAVGDNAAFDLAANLAMLAGSGVAVELR
jgi:Putative DNA-binding domain